MIPWRRLCKLRKGFDAVLYLAKQSRKSGKEKANDIPDWLRELKSFRLLPGESGKDAAKRILDEVFGPGNYDKGSKSYFNQIKKYFDRQSK